MQRHDGHDDESRIFSTVTVSGNFKVECIEAISIPGPPPALIEDTMPLTTLLPQ